MYVYNDISNLKCFLGVPIARIRVDRDLYGSSSLEILPKEMGTILFLLNF